jgi:fumarate hydratase class II
MNMNEVLANRAHEILGGRLGEAARVHPNDHANMSQSTNDTIHTAIHVAAVLEIRDRLLPAMANLEQALGHKAKAFEEVVKCGRTHMQDAVPLRLGQEFGAYASMLSLGRRRVEQATDALRALCIGGTAVGTGLNTPPGYRQSVIQYINETTDESFCGATDLFEAMQNLDAVVEVAGALRVVTVSLRKIAADLILLSSGPRAGLGELRLPAVQPGSSIMPGKVNPVMAEMLSMVCFHALGCDAAITAAAQFGQLELNVMMPVVAYNLLQEIGILAGGMEAFTTRCVMGIEADKATCRRYAERSPALATALSPHVGYHRAAELAMESLKRDALVRDLALEAKLLPEAKLNEVLDVRRMTGNQDAAERSGGSD